MLKYGYYLPTPWSDFFEIRADLGKSYRTAIDALDHADFCLEILDEHTHVYRLYYSKAVATNAVDKLSVHCPICSHAMKRISTVDKFMPSALYECKACAGQNSEV